MPVPQTMSASVQQFQLNYVRPRHREIMRRLVLGQTQADICIALRMSQSRMSIIVNSPLFKNDLRKLEEIRDNSVADVRDDIAELAPDALDEMMRILYTSKSEKHRLKVAESLLDRAGHGAVNRAQVEVGGHINTSNMTKEELANAVIERFDKMRGEVKQREDDIEAGEAIDVEWEEVEETEEVGYGKE